MFECFFPPLLSKIIFSDSKQSGMFINMDVCPLDKLLSLPRWPHHLIVEPCNFRQRWERKGIKEKSERMELSFGRPVK